MDRWGSLVTVGSQISKMYQTQKLAYHSTERISLVSSMIPSLLIGNYVGIDTSDASGSPPTHVPRTDIINILNPCVGVMPLIVAG
jgi:sugar (pentulose or hexulose) kinase